MKAAQPQKMHKSRWHPPGKPPDLLHWPRRPKPCQGMPTRAPGWFLQMVADANTSFPLGPWGWLFFVTTGILVGFWRLWAVGMPAQWLFGPQGWVGLGLWDICCCPCPKLAPKPQHARCGMGTKTPFSFLKGVEILNFQWGGPSGIFGMPHKAGLATSSPN